MTEPFYTMLLHVGVDKFALLAFCFLCLILDVLRFAFYLLRFYFFCFSLCVHGLQPFSDDTRFTNY